MSDYSNKEIDLMFQSAELKQELKFEALRGDINNLKNEILTAVAESGSTIALNQSKLDGKLEVLTERQNSTKTLVWWVLGLIGSLIAMGVLRPMIFPDKQTSEKVLFFPATQSALSPSQNFLKSGPSKH